MGRTARAAPRDTCKGWPNRVCKDPIVETARQLALRLSAITQELGTREVARRAGVDVSVVSRIISGHSWPDTVTLARLERGLQVDLWPRWSEI